MGMWEMLSLAVALRHTSSLVFDRFQLRAAFLDKPYDQLREPATFISELQSWPWLDCCCSLDLHWNCCE
jgi:hypothetical protein